MKHLLIIFTLLLTSVSWSEKINVYLICEWAETSEEYPMDNFIGFHLTKKKYKFPKYVKDRYLFGGPYYHVKGYWFITKTDLDKFKKTRKNIIEWEVDEYFTEYRFYTLTPKYVTLSSWNNNWDYKINRQTGILNYYLIDKPNQKRKAKCMLQENKSIFFKKAKQIGLSVAREFDRIREHALKEEENQYKGNQF